MTSRDMPTTPALAAYYTLKDFAVVDGSYQPKDIFNPVTADLNGDGHQDLIVLGAYYPGGSTAYAPQPGRVLFGDGKGGFTPAPASAFPTSTLATVHSRKVLFADFNGDGRSDMFVSNHGWDATPFPGEQNRLYLSRSDGSFDDATARLPQLSDFSHSSATGDVDGDGDIDIFVGNGYGTGPNAEAAYMLLNDGTGNFTKTRADIPSGAGSVLDFTGANPHHFPGSTLTDLDGDGLPELLVTADAGGSYDALRQSVILWNQGGRYTEAAMTRLPAVTGLPNHIDLDAEPIDFDGDGRQDLIMIGTNGTPFYDGAFVQLLHNDGNRVFTDVTSTAMAAQDAMTSIPGKATGTPWATWIKVIDFNNDGVPDFSVEYSGAPLQQSTPLVWLNDGSGHFTTLKVSDFVAPGDEWRLGNAHVYKTENGYSIISLQNGKTAPYAGLITVGYVASAVYREHVATTSIIGNAGNELLASTAANNAIDGGAGIDTVAMHGKRASYTLTKVATGYQLQDNAGTDGIDTLANVERIKFSDTALALDVDGIAGQAYRLYQAAFNRKPDVAGLGWQMKAMDTGTPLLQVAQNFMDSAEFKSLYGSNPSYSTLVSLLYQNVLHRTPQQLEVDFWVKILDGTSTVAAQQTPAEVLSNFSESAENQAQVIGAIQNGIEYQYYA
ncbi:DUF4214 domain-containing protein [Oxalobacteraceae bacterium OM1]|nr:DUF4214 domain-containing protein [Oxalobacteraceae bacterium OM1]